MEVTIEKLETLFDTKLEPINSKLTAIEETLAQHTRTLDVHTSALDKLLKNKQTKEDEATISAERFDRLEKWAQQVGRKLGIKLEL